MDEEYSGEMERIALALERISGHLYSLMHMLENKDW